MQSFLKLSNINTLATLTTLLYYYGYIHFWREDQPYPHRESAIRSQLRSMRKRHSQLLKYLMSFRSFLQIKIFRKKNQPKMLLQSIQTVLYSRGNTLVSELSQKKIWLAIGRCALSRAYHKAQNLVNIKLEVFSRIDEIGFNEIRLFLRYYWSFTLYSSRNKIANYTATAVTFDTEILNRTILIMYICCRPQFERQNQSYKLLLSSCFE